MCTTLGHLLLLLCFQFRLLPSWSKTASRRVTAGRTLGAWSSLDVVVLSMIITLLEMSTSDLASLGSSGRQLVGKLLDIPFADVSDNAITVNVELQVGTYVLAVVAIFHWLVRPFVLSPLEIAEDDAIDNPPEETRTGSEADGHPEL